MKKKKLLQFGKRGVNINAENSPQEPQPLSTFYRNIIDLPLRNFITCAVDNNLYALVITGKPTDLELQLAWTDIQQEYSDAIGDAEGKLYVSLMKEIILIDAKHGLIKTIAAREEKNGDVIVQSNGILRLIHIPELCVELNKLCNTTFKFDPLEPVKYMELLDRCINRSKSLIIKRALKQQSLDALQKKFDGKEIKKPTRQFFQTMLITLSNHVKYQINDNITVFEYCTRLKELNEFIEYQKASNGR